MQDHNSNIKYRFLLNSMSGIVVCNHHTNWLCLLFKNNILNLGLSSTSVICHISDDEEIDKNKNAEVCYNHEMTCYISDDISLMNYNTPSKYGRVVVDNCVSSKSNVTENSCMEECSVTDSTLFHRHDTCTDNKYLLLDGISVESNCYLPPDVAACNICCSTLKNLAYCAFKMKCNVADSNYRWRDSRPDNSNILRSNVYREFCAHQA